MNHKGHYNRGYLPHRDYSDAVQGVTFRLKDSVPKSVIAKWNEDLNNDSFDSQKVEMKLKELISKYEDQGYGECLLRNKDFAQILQDELIKHHRKHYILLSWCIMPNHVHVLIKQISPWSKIMSQWKGASSFAFNRLRNSTGPLWDGVYHDRYIRDFDHLARAIHYIDQNPVQAGLISEGDFWEFSSVGYGWEKPHILLEHAWFEERENRKKKDKGNSESTAAA